MARVFNVADGFDSKGRQKVIHVNAQGQIIKGTQLQETRLGSECSGSDGELNRVLTLNNPYETGNPVTVWVEGQLISTVDYSVVHLSSNSTITFTGIEIYDLDTIEVQYYV